MNDIKEDDIELLSDNIEYQKKLDFDMIIFRHMDRTNGVLSLGDPDAYGNCVAGLYAMLEWYFDDTCKKDLDALDLKLNKAVSDLVGDKDKLNDTERAEYGRLQMRYVIDKFSILVSLLGRRGKLWMKT